MKTTLNARWMSVGLALAFGLTAMTCAKEKSREDKQREEDDRAFQRLQPAVGSFHGFLVRNSTTGAKLYVPVSVDVAAQRSGSFLFAGAPAGAPAAGSPSSGTPGLLVSMRVGLFGGVTVSATSSTYDWGVGRVDAIFKHKDAALELRGIIKDGAWTNAVLVGPNSGSQELQLNSQDALPFTDDQQFDFQFAMAPNSDPGSLEKSPTRGSFVVKRLPQDQAAPDNIDLPAIPPLDVSMRFSDASGVYQRASTVVYDPLMATIDMQFTDHTRMQMSDVGLSEALALTAKQYTLDRLPATLVQGGEPSARFLMRRGQLNLESQSAGGLPERYFVGRFRGNSSGLIHKAIGYLDYTGSQGPNTGNYAFATFPNMRLKVIVCSGDKSYEDVTLAAIGFDYLTNRAYFQNASKGNLNVDFSSGWQALHGQFVTLTEQAGGHSDDPIVELRATSQLAAVPCQTKDP